MIFTLTTTEASQYHPQRRYIVNEDGTIFEELLNCDEWLPMGHVPMPKTRLGWFLHHLCHGLMMHYPLHKVVLYSLCNTRMEADSTVE